MVLLFLSEEVNGQTKGALPGRATSSDTVKTITKGDTVIFYIDIKNEKKTKVLDIPPSIKTDTIRLPVKNTAKKAAKPPPKVVYEKKNAECGCVAMKVNTADSLQYQAYINYVFSFKNNCKETIWIPSKYFTYVVLMPDDKPVKRLRKLQYVKSYRYPEFVPLKPGTSFDFRFGDDPFFEFDIQKGRKYKIVFIYNNTTHKNKFGKTYLCREMRDRYIEVK